MFGQPGETVKDTRKGECRGKMTQVTPPTDTAPLSEKAEVMTMRGFPGHFCISEPEKGSEKCPRKLKRQLIAWETFLAKRPSLFG